MISIRSIIENGNTPRIEGSDLNSNPKWRSRCFPTLSKFFFDRDKGKP